MKIFRLVVAVIFAAVPSSSWPLKACKVKINPRNGIIYVYASGISGNLLWGTSSGAESASFTNADTCLAPTKATRCQLGATGTPEAITPPPLCTIFVRDSGAECAAH